MSVQRGFLVNVKALSAAVLKIVAFLPNLGQATETVSLVCDRHQIRFDQRCCTKGEFHQPGPGDLKVKMAGAAASVLYKQWSTAAAAAAADR